MPNEFAIDGRPIGPASPPYVIAEISANHNGSIDDALRLIDIAAHAGAHAVKLQHYRPETITIRSPLPEFKVGGGTLWDGRQLFDLYSEAMTPWEWTGELFIRARNHGIACFSTPFDVSAIEFLEQFDPPAYKVASFELVDLPLIRRIAATGRPMVLSTGMATLEEIDAAVDAVRSTGETPLALLRCNSTYPADPSEMDLAAIPFMRERWECEIGLSDHTLDDTSVIAAIALGATIIEKHITIERSAGGPDAAFSLEPDELQRLVRTADEAHRSVGRVRFGPSERERVSLAFRRSLRADRALAAGMVIGPDDVRSMRPAGGLPPEAIDRVIGATLTRDLEVGSAITDDDLSHSSDERH